MARSVDLRILYTDALPNGFSASIQTLRTAAAFARRGHKVTMFHAGPATDAAAVAAFYGEAAWPDTFALEPIEYDGIAGGWRTVRKVMRTSADGEAVAVLGRGAGSHRVFGAPGWRRGTIRLYEMHNIQWLRHLQKAGEAQADPRDIRRLREGERRTIRRVDGLICLTQAVEKAAAELAGDLPRRLVLPSGTSVHDCSEMPRPVFDVAYAGKLEARKGVDDLVHAMTHLRGRTLAVAGGPAVALPALKTRIEAAGLVDRVHLAGPLPASEVPFFLRKARVGICPLPVGHESVSDRFTSPLKLLEMMALGMPVVATDTAPVREIAEDGRDAMLVPPNDPEALARGIDTLLCDPLRAARLGEAARETAARYSWDRRAAALEGFLLDLLGDASERGRTP
jgi:glycosyltransferase involved in cell wall biosynthesis